jgi:hypothetical protein
VSQEKPAPLFIEMICLRLIHVEVVEQEVGAGWAKEAGHQVIVAAGEAAVC